MKKLILLIALSISANAFANTEEAVCKVNVRTDGYSEALFNKNTIGNRIFNTPAEALVVVNEAVNTGACILAKSSSCKVNVREDGYSETLFGENNIGNRIFNTPAEASVLLNESIKSGSCIAEKVLPKCRVNVRTDGYSEALFGENNIGNRIFNTPAEAMALVKETRASKTCS